METLPLTWTIVILAVIGFVVVWVFSQVTAGFLQRLGENLFDWMFGRDAGREE